MRTARSHAPPACRQARMRRRPWRTGLSASPRRKRGSPCGKADRSTSASSSTASAPKAAALRKMAPTLSWLEMPTSTSTSARAGSVASSSLCRLGTPPQSDREDAAMDVEAGDLVHHALRSGIDGQRRRGHAERPGQAGQTAFKHQDGFGGESPCRQTARSARPCLPPRSGRAGRTDRARESSR